MDIVEKVSFMHRRWKAMGIALSNISYLKKSRSRRDHTNGAATDTI